MTRHILGRLAVVFALSAPMALTTGCTVGDNNDRQLTPVEATAELNKLPSLEQATRDLQAAVDQIMAAINGIVPGLSWGASKMASLGGCPPPYDRTDGQNQILDGHYAHAPGLTGEQWSKIVDAAKAKAATVGATTMQVMRDDPNERDVVFTAPDRTEIQIGYRGNIAISAQTACRLSEANRG